MRVLVCGGRDYLNYLQLHSALDALDVQEPITCIIHGGARGADSLAGGWAEQREIDCIRCPAKWGQYGNSAGPIRNRHMLEFKPDLVVAFPGGAGTQNMLHIARAAGIEIKEIV